MNANSNIALIFFVLVTIKCEITEIISASFVCIFINWTNYFLGNLFHSALRRNLMKVWKTWTGPLLGGRTWSRGPKAVLSKILQNKEHF